MPCFVCGETRQGGQEEVQDIQARCHALCVVRQDKEDRKRSRDTQARCHALCVVRQDEEDRKRSRTPKLDAMLCVW